MDPFLERHEQEIEESIGRLHDQAKRLGLQYFYQLMDLVQEKVLGRQLQRPAAPSQPTGTASYVQSLLSSFNLPSTSTSTTTENKPAGFSGDWFSAIGSAVTSVTSSGKSHEARAEELSASGTLFPREMASMSRSEKAQFLSSKRDQLDMLHRALAKEQSNLGDADTETDDLAYGIPLKKNRSDNSFDRIEHDDLGAAGERRTASGGWASGWFGGGDGEMRHRE